MEKLTVKDWAIAFGLAVLVKYIIPIILVIIVKLVFF